MNERECRAEVAGRSWGVCEVCGCKPAESMHHRVKRGQGGGWSPANILHTCGDGTRGCHGWVEAHPLRAAERGLALRSTEDPEARPVWIHSPLLGAGWVLLARDGTATPLPGTVPG